MLYKNSNNNDNGKTNSNVLNFICICHAIATLVTIAYNVTYVYRHHCRQHQHRHHRGSLQKLNIYGNPDALSTTCKAPVKEKILSDNFLESGSSGLLFTLYLLFEACKYFYHLPRRKHAQSVNDNTNENV
uniref:Uncharacterized protein n=1 Tax=Glossina pallidipes TaxID=7398 RepID=A0A1A9Z6Q3_GLOPL